MSYTIYGANITPLQIDSLHAQIYSKCEKPKCLDEKIEAFSFLNTISKEWHEKEYSDLKSEFESLNDLEHKNKLDLSKIKYFISIGEHEHAISISHSFLEKKEELSLNFVATVHNLLGIAYHNLGDFTNSMKNYLLSQRLYIENGEILLATYPLGNQADIYVQLEAYDKALEKNQEALQLSKQLLGEERYYNMGWDLIRIAEILLFQGKLAEAKEKFHDARELVDLSSDRELKAFSLSAYVEFLTATQNYEGAAIVRDELMCELSDQITVQSNLYPQHIVRELKYLVGISEFDLAKNLIENVREDKLFGYKLSYLKAKYNLYKELKDEKKVAQTNQEISDYLEENFRTKISSYLQLMDENSSFETLHKENVELRSTSKKQRSVINFILFLVLAFLVASVAIASMLEKLKVSNRQLQKMNHSISQKNNELEQLNYTTTHDIKEPLNTIYHFTHLLKDKYGESLQPEVAQMISIIHKASKDSKEQISGIQKYLRLGELSELTSFSVKNLLSELVLELDEIIQKKDAKITIHKMPKIQGNENEIKHLFENLILNAIYHSKKKENTIIEISHAENAEYHLFNIQDNGIGISEEYQNKIFDLFQVLDLDKDSTRKGTGLANSKKIVELHQGEIWVNSKVGIGSTFSFTLKKDLV